MQALAEAVGVQLAPDCYLFSDSVDSRTPWKPEFVSLAFRRFADSVGADDVRLHDLRHYVVIYRPAVDMSYLSSA